MLLAASHPITVPPPPPLPAQRNSLPVQPATLAQAEKMKEIDKYCENLQVQVYSNRYTVTYVLKFGSQLQDIVDVRHIIRFSSMHE